MDLASGVELMDQLGHQANFGVRFRSARLACIDISGRVHAYQVTAASTPPNPARVARDLERLARLGSAGDARRLLYVVPRLTASLRAASLADHRIAVAAVDDATVILDGRVWSRDQVAVALSAPRGRKPWGRMALARVLLRSGEPRSQAALAKEAGVTQQAVALALAALADCGVERRGRGWTTISPDALWDAFMAQYPGPGGLRRRWTSPAALEAQVARASEAALASETTMLLSGDAAADRQAPMRRPRSATVFTSSDIDLSSRFAPADDGEATLSVVVPADPTVFATARAWGGDRPECTDPVLTAWEVAHSTGADRDDAVSFLKARVLADRAAT